MMDYKVEVVTDVSPTDVCPTDASATTTLVPHIEKTTFVLSITKNGVSATTTFVPSITLKQH